MRCGGCGKGQGLGQLGQGPVGLALVGQPAHLLAASDLGRVAGGQLHELPALAALRHVPAPPCGRARLVRKASSSLASGRCDGHQDARRDGAGAGVVLLHERGQGLLVRGVGEVLEQEDVAARRLAVADGEELDGGLLARARVAERRPGRAWRSRPSSGSPWSARWRAPCRAGRPRARTRAPPRRPPCRPERARRPAPGGPRGRA